MFVCSVFRLFGLGCLVLLAVAFAPFAIDWRPECYGEDGASGHHEKETQPNVGCVLKGVHITGIHGVGLGWGLSFAHFIEPAVF